MEAHKIAIAGPSGMGKSTLAGQLSSLLQMPFISGSYRKLNDKYKDTPHKDMIERDPSEIYQDDMQLLGIRRNLFRDNDEIISDRSFLDSAAYMIEKLAHRHKQCDIETFLEQCKKLTLSYNDVLIFLPLPTKYLDSWKFEDDGKRITNKYYQWKISYLMEIILNLWGWQCDYLCPVYKTGFLTDGILTTRVMILNPESQEIRRDTALHFIQRV